jgi:hypothetical protein
LSSLLLFSACDEDNDDLDSNATVSEADVLGSWEVERYLDGSEDETSSFSDINLVFDTGGVFRMLRNAQPIADGNWQLRDRNSELYITIPALADENETLGEDLYELHDDWRIRFEEGGRMNLRDEDESFLLRKRNNQ